MKIKRIVAYLIDMAIVYVVAALILSIPVFQYDTEKYMDYYKEYTDLIIETKEVTDEVVDNQYKLMYKMSYLAKNSLVIQAVVTFAYKSN